MMNRLTNSLVVLALLGCDRTAPQPAVAQSPFDRAGTAFMRIEIDDAEKAYRETLRDDTSSTHREQARATLANLTWRVRGDVAEALRILNADTALAARPRILAERSRALTAAGHHDAATRTAGQALRNAKTFGDTLSSVVAIGTASLAPYRTGQLRGSPNAALADALGVLSRFVHENPGRLRPANLLIDVAAIAGDGPAMLLGWRSYYLTGLGDTTTGPLVQPRRELAALLPRWDGRSKNAADRWAIARALGDSRLFDAAHYVIISGEPADTTDARLRDLVNYRAYLREIERTTDEYYRQTALGTASKRQWERSLESAGRALWDQLSFSGERPRYDDKRLEAELDRRFGTLITKGETSGYSDLHMGHRVVDTRQTVTQYGRSADIRFVALDALVSNGFQSWAWDGRAAHGGWADAEKIVQVRPGYADGGIRAWQKTSDPVERAREDSLITRDSAQDLARARSTPVAHFPSISARFERAARRALLDSLKGAGLSGPPLQASFERLIVDAEFEASIIAHEGRHAIDATIGMEGSTADREFRAKLSQVVFAPRPAMNLGGIFNESIGDATGHGKANLRVAEGILSWLEANKGKISGLNPTLPLLPQLPLLTDAQLREAFRSLDPLGKTSRASELRALARTK